MKRWTKEAIDLLKQQSEQSRTGQPITPGNGLNIDPSAGALVVTAGPPGRPRPKNVTVIPANVLGEPIELHVRHRPKRRRR